MTTITVRLTEEQKMAIKGFSQLKNTSVSDVILSSVLEKIENEEDYALAIEASKAPICLSSIDDLARECGIDYATL